jgi:hypothetical protein
MSISGSYSYISSALAERHNSTWLPTVRPPSAIQTATCLYFFRFWFLTSYGFKQSETRATISLKGECSILVFGNTAATKDWRNDTMSPSIHWCSCLWLINSWMMNGRAFGHMLRRIGEHDCGGNGSCNQFGGILGLKQLATMISWAHFCVSCSNL